MNCDTLLYPYGSEVEYTTEKGTLLTADGFRYLIGLWAEGDHLEVNRSVSPPDPQKYHRDAADDLALTAFLPI